MLLLFKREYIPLILSGKKRATIRPGEKRVRPGNIVVFVSGRQAFARGRVKRVERKKLKELTLEEIKKDGFQSFHDLFKALKSIYPELTVEDVVTYIEWELLD